MSMLRCVIALVWLVGLAGCAFRDDRRLPGAERPPWANGLQSLQVEPPSATVTIDNGSPGQQPFRALALFGFGRIEDVTDRVSWASSNDGIASVSAAGLATTGTITGGRVTVTARVADIMGSALLAVRMREEATAGGPGAQPELPTNPGKKLAGPVDDKRAPELVYPNDGVLLPPNLFRIEVHFRRGSATNTLFEIAFANDLTDIRVYTRCVPLADGCLYEPAREIWSGLAETNRGGKPVKLTVRGTDDAGSAVGASAAHAVQFSHDVIRGALYYWTTSRGSGVMRWDFGNAQQTDAERVLGTEHSGGTCIGCHALSRDGKKMILSAGGQNDGRLLLFDIVARRPMRAFPLGQKSQFESWNPDGTSFVGVYGDGGEQDLILFDGTTGARTGTIPLGGLQGDHPDWSADGTRIAFTAVGQKLTDQRPGRGAIAYVVREGTGWSTPHTLVASARGTNHYYPAISPDGTFAVYDQSRCPGGLDYDRLCNADMDPSARLWAVRFPGKPGAAALASVELRRANAGGVADSGATDLTNSFPKWSPFVFALNEQSKLMWLTVSSSRQYGLRKPPAGSSENPSGTLLWMIGVEPAKLLAGEDPSFTAFCLPFQDISTSNHIAQWTSDVPKIP